MGSSPQQSQRRIPVLGSEHPKKSLQSWCQVTAKEISMVKMHKVSFSSFADVTASGACSSAARQGHGLAGAQLQQSCGAWAHREHWQCLCHHRGLPKWGLCYFRYGPLPWMGRDLPEFGLNVPLYSLDILQSNFSLQWVHIGVMLNIYLIMALIQSNRLLILFLVVIKNVLFGDTFS